MWHSMNLGGHVQQKSVEGKGIRLDTGPMMTR
jgi:hypothetical protein